MKFTIGFEKEDAKKFHECVDEIIDTQQWTESKFTTLFEERWAPWNGLPSLAFSSWSGAAQAALEYFKVQGKTVLCPSNTFMATPLSVVKAGAPPRVRGLQPRGPVPFLRRPQAQGREVQAGGGLGGAHRRPHRLRDRGDRRLCKERDIVLLEDCAHAHGASWNGRKPGTWGAAGVYSFYATKTITMGEGGILATADPGLLEYAKRSRNYGKPDYAVPGQNQRITEFGGAGRHSGGAARRSWPGKRPSSRKHLDPKYPNRVKFPAGMISGYYKYIVFDPIEKSTGKVYDQPCHRIMGRDEALPVTDWAAKHHWCVPLYYKGE